MINNLHDLYDKINTESKFVPFIDERDGHTFWEGVCPECGGQHLFLYEYGSDVAFCRDCNTKVTMFLLLTNYLNLSIHESVLYVTEKTGFVNEFDYRQFAKIVHPRVFEKNQEHTVVTFTPPFDREDAQPCEQCGCQYFVYKITGSNVKPYCLFCGKDQPCLKKIKNKTKNARGHEAVTWSHRVWSRYGGRCALCGSKEEVEAHHIVSWSVDEQQRYNVNNGILLCKKHHNLAHKPVFVKVNNEYQV